MPPTPDIGVWGRGAQTGNSLQRGVCVYERVACVMERRRMLAGQIRGSECTSSPPARILDWGLSRFCLGFVSVLSRCCLAPPPPNSLSPNGWRYRYFVLKMLPREILIFTKSKIIFSCIFVRIYYCLPCTARTRSPHFARRSM